MKSEIRSRIDTIQNAMAVSPVFEPEERDRLHWLVKLSVEFYYYLQPNNARTAGKWTPILVWPTLPSWMSMSLAAIAFNPYFLAYKVFAE